METAQWPKDQRIDWILFRAQLEGAAFDDRVWHSTSRDPQTYVGECSNAIFSLLKKDYDTPQKRAAAATARLQAMPALLAQGEKNLTEPVKLFAQLAIASARAIDPLFNDSLMSLAKDLPPNEHKSLVEARDAALQSIHEFADHLEKKLPAMVAFTPMGEENYNFYLHHHAPSPSRCSASGDDRAGRAGAIPRLRSVVARSLTGRSRSETEQEHSAEPGRVSQGL